MKNPSKNKKIRNILSYKSILFQPATRGLTASTTYDMQHETHDTGEETIEKLLLLSHTPRDSVSPVCGNFNLHLVLAMKVLIY